MGFTLKTVNAEGGLGKDLAELRERAGITLEEASKATKLPPSVIRALEEEDWEQIPDPVHWERQVRAYVSFLGGNVSYFVLKYRDALQSRALKAEPRDFLPRPIVVRPIELTVGPRWVALGGFVLLLLGLGGYVYYQASAISSAPPLVLEEPSDGARLGDPVVRVRGKTLPESAVTVNGADAVVGTDGEFSMNVHVPRGTTMIIVSARRRHGKEATEVRRVMYERETSRAMETKMQN